MTAREKFAGVRRIRLRKGYFRKCQPKRMKRTGEIIGFCREQLVRVVWDGSKTPIVYHMDNLEAAE